jgi:hypothetical protein
MTPLANQYPLASRFLERIASAAIKTGRGRNDFSVERITTEQYQTLSQFLS